MNEATSREVRGNQNQMTAYGRFGRGIGTPVIVHTQGDGGTAVEAFEDSALVVGTVLLALIARDGQVVRVAGWQARERRFGRAWTSTDVQALCGVLTRD